MRWRLDRASYLFSRLLSSLSFAAGRNALDVKVDAPRLRPSLPLKYPPRRRFVSRFSRRHAFTMSNYARYSNYIGILHEWCQKYPSRRDTSETYTAIGPPHIRIFTCTTTVSGVPEGAQDVFVGEGSTKKESKSRCFALSAWRRTVLTPFPQSRLSSLPRAPAHLALSFSFPVRPACRHGVRADRPACTAAFPLLPFPFLLIPSSLPAASPLKLSDRTSFVRPATLLCSGAESSLSRPLRTVRLRRLVRVTLKEEESVQLPRGVTLPTSTCVL